MLQASSGAKNPENPNRNLAKMSHWPVGMTGVFEGESGKGEDGGGTKGGDGPGSCKFSFSISNIVFRSPW